MKAGEHLSKYLRIMVPGTCGCKSLGAPGEKGNYATIQRNRQTITDISIGYFSPPKQNVRVSADLLKRSYTAESPKE